MDSGSGLGIQIPPVASPPNPLSEDPYSQDVKAITHVSPLNPLSNPDLTLRSSKGMKGLLLAEVGASMVELDIQGGPSGFREGQRITPGSFTPVGTFSNPPRRQVSHSFYLGNNLTRHGTLLSRDVPSVRNAAELKSLLGDSRSRVKAGATILPSHSRPSSLGRLRTGDNIPASVALEQGKLRARVEVDIILESLSFVEGGYLNGQIHVKVRKRSKKEGSIGLSGGKVRVAGFEVIRNDEHRHIFYHVSAPLADVASGCHELYTSPPDCEGFGDAREGHHILPLSMKLPVGGPESSAKGVFNSPSEAAIRYIAVISIGVKERETNKRSIAHFYRNCQVWPAFDPFTILAPSPHPIHATCSKKLFMGGNGTLKMTAELARRTWIAGQRCYVKVTAANDTKKTVKSLNLTLIRTTTIFQPKPHIDAATPNSDLSGDQDACQTSTTKKQVAESTLCAGQRGIKGHVSAKGWWTGIEPGEKISVSHFIILPVNALSVTRSRLLEVEYALRVTLSSGSLTSDIHVILPLRIVNFLSIDPPPSVPMATRTPKESVIKSSIILDSSPKGTCEGSAIRPICEESKQPLKDSRFMNGGDSYALGYPEDADEFEGALSDISDSLSVLPQEKDSYDRESCFGEDYEDSSMDYENDRRTPCSESRVLTSEQSDLNYSVDSNDGLSPVIGAVGLEAIHSSSHDILANGNSIEMVERSSDMPIIHARSFSEHSIFPKCGDSSLAQVHEKASIGQARQGESGVLHQTSFGMRVQQKLAALTDDAGAPYSEVKEEPYPGNTGGVSSRSRVPDSLPGINMVEKAGDASDIELRLSSRRLPKIPGGSAFIHEDKNTARLSPAVSVVAVSSVRDRIAMLERKACEERGKNTSVARVSPLASPPCR